MTCPNCGQIMVSSVYNEQTVLHCRTCGSSFFEEKGIDKISLEIAETLANDQQEAIIMGKPKVCPKDGKTLVTIERHPTKLFEITVLHCPVCRGVFIYPDDLLKLKIAGNSKASFLKTWNKPLPSIKAIGVFAFVALVSFSLLSNFNTNSRSTIQQSQAKDLINKVNFTVSSDKHYLFVYFSTIVPVKSTIIFFDSNTNQIITKTISAEIKSMHNLTIGDLNLEHQLSYQILLTDEKGKTVQLEKKALIIGE